MSQKRQPKTNQRGLGQKRYLGLELSGAKNSKTTIAVLEYYPKEKKVFLLDVHAGIGADETTNSDDVLVETILDHADGHPDIQIGVNVPLTLPPIFAGKSGAGDIKWMKQFSARAAIQTPRKAKISKKTARMKEFFTPYTQRPVELWLKHGVLCKIPERLRFEIDETLGGNKAPLTARMHYLKPFLGAYALHEVLPKLTVALLMPKLKLSYRVLELYRQLDGGVGARQTIIERIAENLDVFIYDRDLKKLTQNINAFDAFLCAYTVLLSDRDECVEPPKGFPTASGWVRYPNSSLIDPNASNVEPGDFDDDENED